MCFQCDHVNFKGMLKSLKSRRVHPPGKRARFREPTIAFQLKENKRPVKESKIPFVPSKPPPRSVSPKRYVCSPLAAVFTLLPSGNASGSVLVTRIELAWPSVQGGQWHSTSCCQIAALLSHLAQSSLIP